MAVHSKTAKQSKLKHRNLKSTTPVAAKTNGEKWWNGNCKRIDADIEKTGQQNIEDIEAFVVMERAKLEDDPDYDQSFLLEALDE